MKTIKFFIMALMLCFTLSSFSQNEQSIQKCKDEMTDKEYVFIKKKLLCIKDNKTGFAISINLKQNSEKSIFYDGFNVKSVGIGGCVENNTLIFLFEDSTKFNITSWNDFNCEGKSYFDLRGKEFEKFSTKRVKAIRFQNGRSYESYTYILSETEKDYFIKVAELIKLNSPILVPTCN